MDNNITFRICFEKMGDELGRHMLLEYKFLQSLRSVTRGITHNYNNIFTGVMGQVSLLTDQSKMTQNVILEDLLTRGISNTETLFGFARFLEDDVMPHSLSGVLQNVTQTLQAVSPSVTISTIKTHELLKVHGCLSRLVLMLFFVGENAIEAMVHGGNIIFSISRPRGEENGKWVNITIEDDGPGVNAELIESMFSPFISTKGGTHRGIGLHIARQLAREYGGDLSADANRSKGAMFTFTLPIYETRLLDLPPVPVKEQSEKGKEFGKRNHVFFIIDDDPLLLDYLVKVLQRRGHIVFSASTCEEALDEYQHINNIITVFLVDVGLSDCEGFECVRRLRQINENVDVIFMSGDSVNNHPHFPAQSSFISKPFTAKQIEELANNVAIND